MEIVPLRSLFQDNCWVFGWILGKEGRHSSGSASATLWLMWKLNSSRLSTFDQKVPDMLLPGVVMNVVAALCNWKRLRLLIWCQVLSNAQIQICLFESLEQGQAGSLRLTFGPFNLHDWVPLSSVECVSVMMMLT